MTSVLGNVESISLDFMFLSRQDTYFTERGRDEKFDLCQVTRSRGEVATEKRGTSGFPRRLSSRNETSRANGSTKWRLYRKSFVHTFLQWNNEYYNFNRNLFSLLTFPALFPARNINSEIGWNLLLDRIIHVAGVFSGT